MKRLVFQCVKDWAQDDARKPLILRGARQVGKTHLVRQAGKLFDHFVEINFEALPEAASIFQKNLDPRRIVKELELLTDQTIILGKTLLFLDEIQIEPRAILALRYFYEKMPKLHVIAAGSLLDFAIEQVGVPVGRVNYLWLRPMSFIEFLMANDMNRLADEILQHPVTELMSPAIHDKLLDAVATYMCVGGMPEAVLAWSQEQDLRKCQTILNDIVTSYRQDFEKYSKQGQMKYVELLFQCIPLQLGQPFLYAKASSTYRKRELSPCVDLLRKAGIVHIVYKSSGQGVPIGAGVDLDKFKLSFIDVALAQQILGLGTEDWILNPSSAFANKRQLVEAFVGQEILAYSSPRQDANLYYWSREQRGSQAEVDYLIQNQSDVIPVEVKSGKGNTLQSMHAYLKSHKAPYGLRVSTHNYSTHENIYLYPLYAISRAKSGEK